MVAVTSDESTVTVGTQSALTGAAPATSFACLLSKPASQLTLRLQATDCANAGGMWLTFAGGSLTINVANYPQFIDATFTIQVAANDHANNANGDAFYNNFTVSTVPGNGGGGGIA